MGLNIQNIRPSRVGVLSNILYEDGNDPNQKRRVQIFILKAG
jgi:hypothetical protein